MNVVHVMPCCLWLQERQRQEQSPSSSTSTSKSLVTRGSFCSTKGTSSICADFPPLSEVGDSSAGLTPTPLAEFSSSCRSNLPSLSSPESAYSTGCSADISPSQDGFEPEDSGAAWRRSIDDSVCSAQSPRTRSAIRTNPWVSARSSLTLTEKSSWTPADAADSPLPPPPPPSAPPQQMLQKLNAMKETEILSDIETAGREAEPVNHLCDSFELLMEGDHLRAVTRQVTEAYKKSGGTGTGHPAGMGGGAEARKHWEMDIDAQYTQLIRETEEILTQLENDEFILFGRKQEEPELVSPPPCTNARGGQSLSQRKKARKAVATRRCSREFHDVATSSESDLDYRDSAANRKSEWRKLKGGHQRIRVGRSSAPSDDHNNRHVTPQHCWMTNSDWREDDRPPSPAPMDPQCHWTPGIRPPLNPPQIIHDYIDPVWQDDAHNHWRAPSAFNSQQQRRNPSSCPASPAVYGKDPCTNRWSGGRGVPQFEPSPRRSREWRRTWKEQQRLESQIAFLRRQLMKNATDCYDRDGGSYDRPLSTSSSASCSSSSSSSPPSYSLYSRSRPSYNVIVGHQPPLDFRPV